MEVNVRYNEVAMNKSPVGIPKNSPPLHHAGSGVQNPPVLRNSIPYTSACPECTPLARTSPGVITPLNRSPGVITPLTRSPRRIAPAEPPIITPLVLPKLQKKNKKAIVEHLREFGDGTTLHGIRYISDKNKHPCERLSWIIVLIVCSAYCCAEMYQIWDRWQHSPVITSFAQRTTSVASIPLPALTICPENKIKKSVIDMEEKFEEILACVNKEKEFESDEQKLLYESISMVCLNKTIVQDLMLYHPMKPTRKHTEIIANKISPQMNDIFEACYIADELVNCRAIFRPILTSFGLCYSFNTVDDKDLYAKDANIYPFDVPKSELRDYVWDADDGYSKLGNRNNLTLPIRTYGYEGQHVGLMVELKSPPEDLQEMCSTRDADSFRITVQSHSDFPDPQYYNYFHATPGGEIAITLRPTSVTTAKELRNKRYNPRNRGCMFAEDAKLELYNIYTKENCMRECSYMNVLNNCGCQFNFVATTSNCNVSYCNITDRVPHECGKAFYEQLNRTFRAGLDDQIQGSDLETAPCNCLPSCSEIIYQYQVLRTEFKNKKIGNIDRSNQTTIKMYYESGVFVSRHRSELYGVTDFIASCGGLLGLFTGFSVITAFEIIYFATLRLFCKLNEQTIRARHS